jgi:hypothetical protein
LAFLSVPVLLLKMPTQTAIIIGFLAIAVSKVPQSEKEWNALPHQNAPHIDEIGGVGHCC